MNKINWFQRLAILFGVLTALSSSGAEAQIKIEGYANIPGNTPPLWVSLSGFSGEALQVLQFDLYVQGFNFTNSAGAQYLLSGSNSGNLQGQATDRYNKQVILSKAYSGASLRRQAHAFVDDFERITCLL